MSVTRKLCLSLLAGVAVAAATECTGALYVRRYNRPQTCAPGSIFIAKPYRHDDILTACRGLRPRSMVG